MPFGLGLQPPQSPVPAPRAVTGMPCSLAQASMRHTTSTVWGRTTAIGIWPCCPRPSSWL
jgi:hypothetical protein